MNGSSLLTIPYSTVIYMPAIPRCKNMDKKPDE